MEMMTREIPPGEWGAFLDEFSRRHWNRLVNAEVLGFRIGAQLEARDVPLRGVFYEPASRAITIRLGREPEGHIEHPVQAPERVWVEIGENGAEAALEIEAKDGTKTILEFRTVAAPEAVDGWSRSR